MKKQVSVFKLSECKTGTDFENWVQSFLTHLGFDAKRTCGNDNEVDIIATKIYQNVSYKFYIQCKYHNRVLGKTPIQEVYTGHQYFGGDGYPVVITNNRMTYEAKTYALRLGVEVISELQLNELSLMAKGHAPLSMTHTGLFGIIVSTICRDADYVRRVFEKMTQGEASAPKEHVDDKEQLRSELVDSFEQADILMQESAELQQRASLLNRQALVLQKEALIKNLEYG